jgi:hypothetical protein
MEFHYVAWADLKHLGSSDPPTSAPPNNCDYTHVCANHAWLKFEFLKAEAFGTENQGQVKREAQFFFSL